MNKYILVTESGSDLPKHYIDKYNIKIVQMHVNFGDTTYDDCSLKANDVFDYYNKTGNLPRTSGSNPKDFNKIFEEINSQYPNHQIIYIAYSSVTTVSYNSAKIAAENFNNVNFVDSKNVSVGLAFIVIKTAQYIEKNPDASVEEIIAYVENIRERVKFVFLPQTLKYLKEGGRISNASYLGAKLLKIYPTINLIDGYLVAGKKYRGSFKKAFIRLIDDYFEKFDILLDDIKLVKVHGLENAIREEITKLIEAKGAKNIEWIDAGAVISTHGGPGAFGIIGMEA